MSERPNPKSAENIIPMILDVYPLILEVSSPLMKILKESEKGEHSFVERISRLRNQVALSLGVVFPSVRVRENVTLAPYNFLVKIREVEVKKGEVKGEYSALNCYGYISQTLSRVVQEYAYEFLGTNEVQGLLNHLRSLNPSLVQGVYPTLIGLGEIHRILQNLLREGIPIRDLVKILETLSEYAPYTRDSEVLTEYVRHALARTIGSLYQSSYVIKAYLLEPQIEQWILGAIRWEDGTFLDLDSEIAGKILKALRKRFQPTFKKEGAPVLLVAPEIRRFVRMLTETIAPKIPVLAHSEISSEYRVKILGMLHLDSWKEAIKKVFYSMMRKKEQEVFPGDNLQKAIVILSLIGSSANQVGQYLAPAEREMLKARSMIAPVPTQGKKQVLDEFIKLLPPEKQVTNLELLIQLANQEPFAVALVLQKNWLTILESSDEGGAPIGFPSYESHGREETGPREKAAVFISSAARWVQEDVYRLLSVEDLRELGYGMLQFPFISPEGKRRAWDEHEGTLYKDEWWDPDTLARFVQASMQGRVEDFKKRGFRQAQKLAVLLLSLPAPFVMVVGKMVLESLPKTALQQVLGEMGQWRDHLPVEARTCAIQDFVDYAVTLQKTDFQLPQKELFQEVERIIQQDPKGALAIIRNLWFSPPDLWLTFESLVTSMPYRVANWLISYFQIPKREFGIPRQKRVSFFMNGVRPDLREKLREEMTLQEKGLLELGLSSKETKVKLFKEFVSGYHGTGYQNPISYIRPN